MSDAAVRFDSFMTDDNIPKDNEREPDKQSKSITQNRLQVELNRYTKIGAIDKQVVFIARQYTEKMNEPNCLLDF